MSLQPLKKLVNGTCCLSCDHGELMRGRKSSMAEMTGFPNSATILCRHDSGTWKDLILIYLTMRDTLRCRDCGPSSFYCLVVPRREGSSRWHIPSDPAVGAQRRQTRLSIAVA